MPLTVKTEHVDFHFAFDTRTKHLVVLFDEFWTNGRGRVYLRPYAVTAWAWIDHRSHYQTSSHEICMQVLEEFMTIKGQLKDIRHKLKTDIQKELFENDRNSK